MSNIIDSIQLSGVTYTLQGSGGGGNPTVELTQAQYDALVSAGTVASDTYYIITDATPADISQYWTSAQTQSAITSAVSTKQDALVSGTNIKTINNESILGSGNIDIQGGGSITVDTELSTTSENPVQNKVITEALNGKGDTLQWDATSTARKNIPLRLKRGSTILSEQALSLGDYLQYGSPTSSALCITGLTPTTDFTAYTATTYTKTEVDTALASKQTTLTAGTNITIVDNVISATGGGGGGTVESAITSGSTNAVESSAIYDATHVDLIDLWKSTDKSNLRDTTQSLYKFYVQYSGDTALDEQVSVQIRYGSNNTWETLYGNVFQETATTSSVFTSTFDNGKWIIESSSPNYIGQIYTDYRFRIWSYNRTIGNKFAADSIENDIIPYIGDVVTKAENAIANAGLTSNGSKGLGIFFDKGNGNSLSAMVTLDDLKYSNNTLSTDIQIPTGEVGWMDFTTLTTNCSAGDIPTNKVKVTYSGQTVSASARRIRFQAYFKRTDGNVSSYYPQITWSDTTTPVANNCSAVTATYDSTDDSVIIELPSGETTYDGYTGTFSIKNLTSDSCQFGTGISSVKYYGDITEDIYTAMAHKQDTLSAGTGIEISGNVISATGGGGSITVDDTLSSTSTNPVQNKVVKSATDRICKIYGFGTSGQTDILYWSTGATSNVIDGYVKISRINGKHIISQSYSSLDNLSLVETSAITTSVTSTSTDDQVPSAKCVYDTLGGLKLVKLTQNAYDALSPDYDSNTLYVIVN